MCYPPAARPPEVPQDLLRPISGGTAGEAAVLTSADGTRFCAYLGRAGVDADAGIVIAPDVRGLHRFYEELAERFAGAGVHAVAFDYFGRTAGAERRADDFEFMPHVQKTRPETVQADIAASLAHLRSATRARRLFVLGFCFGGRSAFNAAAEQTDLTGVVGFYGRLSEREGEVHPVPAKNASRMRAAVLGLFGGADAAIPPTDVATFNKALTDAKVRYRLETYPGAPHSFFDRTFDQHKDACADAWRRVLGFVATGDPTAKK